jgi:hypothetical protein
MYYCRKCRTLVPALPVVGYTARHNFPGAFGEATREANLVRILRRLTVPASESQMAIALAMSVVMMSLLLYGIIWQSNIITYQRDLIHVIWPGH